MINIRPPYLIYITILWLFVSYITGIDFNFSVYAKGFLSYLSLATLISFLIYYLSEKKQLFAHVICISIISLTTEHILINNANPDVNFLGMASNSTFIVGSLLNFRFLVLILSLLISFWGINLLVSRYVFRVPVRLALGICTLLLGLDFLISSQISHPFWMQKNLVTQTLINLHSDLYRAPPANSQDIKTREKIYGNIIENQSVNNGKKNIILLILEGFSEDYLNRGLTPHLKKIINSNFHVPHFITNQVQTNRGLYTILCDDYDNLGSSEAKADIISTHGAFIKCLPEMLKESGYHTIFTQSAPMSFMRKDLFAKATGFKLYSGSEVFKKNDLLSSWGISDGKLFESVISQTKNQKTHAPYFITILTSGTHHPFIIPGSTGDQIAAIKYTDQEIQRFHDKLLSQGFFKDGILVITSDEARPIIQNGPYILKHHGLFGVIGNGIQQHSQSHLFSQLDITVSIMDYIEADKGKFFLGKSVFRTPKNRRIYVGNAFQRKPMMVEDDKTVHLCNQGYTCEKAVFKKSMFNLNESPKISPSENSNEIKSFVTENDKSFINMKSRILFSENEFQVKGEKILLWDFKTAGEQENLFYQLKIQSGTNIDSKLWLEFSVYPCWEPRLMIVKKFEVNPNHSKFEIPLETSQWKSKQALCHSAKLSTTGNDTLSIKKFDFLSKKSF